MNRKLNSVLALALAGSLALLSGCGQAASSSEGASSASSGDTLLNLYTWEGMFPQDVLDGITAEQLTVKELLARLGDDTVKEVIMAMNPTVEGDATAMYLAKLIKPLGIKVTRLAYGLPTGSSLEYADESTLYRALSGRGEL